MADDHHHNLPPPPPPPPSRLGVRHQQDTSVTGGCGEIVEVQGGHIVRSTGRKDRHSKVCTAKGPRDRRVRLSAPTAIQFYDVQDRLGFDRPSKAVDWLIKKAKSAIDELAELPPWNPAETLRLAAATAKPRRTKNPPPSLHPPPPPPHEDPHGQFTVEVGGPSVSARGSGGPPTAVAMVVGLGEVQQQRNIGQNPNNENESNFLPPSLDSDSIADTIKSFFPIGGACASTEAQQQLIQSYHPPPPPDLLSRTNSQNQDLRLSLQSLHDPSPLILHNHHHHHHHSAATVEPVLFAGQNVPVGFDTAAGAGWEQSHSHHNHHQQSHQSLQRPVAWNSSGAFDAGGGGGGGFVFASPSMTTSFQSVFGQSQLFSQRGPLQSINTPVIRAWFDPHHHHHQQHHVTSAADDVHHHHPYQSAIHGAGFAPQIGEFSNFRIPARIQGEGEEQHGINNKPSSVSSVSRH